MSGHGGGLGVLEGDQGRMLGDDEKAPEEEGVDSENAGAGPGRLGMYLTFPLFLSLFVSSSLSFVRRLLGEGDRGALL